MERADAVLAVWKVDSGLSADGRVHHCKQRGRRLDERDSAHVSRGNEARQVAGDSAAKRDYERPAVKPGLQALLGKHSRGL